MDEAKTLINHKRMFLINIRKDKLEENNYRFAKIERLIGLADFDMDHTFFGGNVHTIAKLKGKNYYLLVNSRHETIGICARMDELDNFSRNELVEWAEIHHIKVDKSDSKNDLVSKLRGL